MAKNRAMLKEAIAEAKAVKDMAIANAKAALEEAFSPQLKSMLSMKLQEMENDELEESYADMDPKGGKYDHGNIEESDEDDNREEIDLEDLLKELEGDKDENEKPLKEAEEEEEDEDEEEGEALNLEDLTDEDLKQMIEDVIKDMIKDGELEAGHEGGEEEEGEEMEMSDDEEVDLAELLREIEEMEEPMYEEDDELVDEGFMDNIVKAMGRFGSSGRIEDLRKEIPMKVRAGKALAANGTIDSFTPPTEQEIEDLISQAKQDGGTGELKVSKEEGRIIYVPGSDVKGAAQASTFEENLKSELKEAYSTIKALKNELNEINLLNAKLLYTNKIFKSRNLNESQKVKVLSSFDKATTVGEVKVVFETLNEGIKENKNTIKENLGRASKTTVTPTVKKPIVESNDAFLRMQKLAGIIK